MASTVCHVSFPVTLRAESGCQAGNLSTCKVWSPRRVKHVPQWQSLKQSASQRFNGRQLRIKKNAITRCSGEKTTTQTEEKKAAEIKVPEGFEPPKQLKKFVPRGDQWFAIVTGSLNLLFRFGGGALTLGYTLGVSKAAPGKYSVLELLGYGIQEEGKGLKGLPRPQKPLEIYEFEGCPFCRKVREMLTILDLDVMYYPCPQNGPTYRPKAIAMGGKRQFPYLVDPNTGVSMYESDEIIKYLANTYGDGSVPLILRLGPLTTITAGFAMIARGTKGSGYVPAKMPSEALEVWAYEASPFCKVVREALCELELPFLYHNVGRGSPKRQEFLQRMGVFQVPYLEDPNTGVKMFESAEIVDYLYATYALPKN